MAITLGGIMRGALPVLQQAVEAPMQDAVARMDSIGKLYNAKAGEFQKKQAEVLSDKDKIETIAKSFGVDMGIAEQAYKISGKSVDKASKIVTNMLSAYDNQIPITKVDVDKLATEPVPEVTKIENVDIAPKNASNNSIFNSFKNLFKYYSPDQVVEMFAERSNIPIDQVRKVLSGTFDMPELNVTQRATPEAIAKGISGPPSSGGQFQQKLNSMMNVIRAQPGNANKSDEDIRALAEQAILNPPQKGAQGEMGVIIYGEGGPRLETIDRFVDGKLAAPSREIEEANKELIGTNYKNFDRIGLLRRTLAKYPNAFNILGQFRRTASDFADIFGASGLAKDLGGADLQFALQSSIEFFKGAKDAIFKDPRISDQDKALIERYIGILNDPTIGQSRAMAAIAGLERQFVSSMASAFAVNYGAGKKGGISVIETGDDGVLDINKVSVAKMVFDQLVRAQRLDVTSTDQTMQIQVAQAMILAKNSVGAFQASMDPRYTSLNDYTTRAPVSPFLIQIDTERT
tara:strand:+ start:2312 stop:3862 length:1551 start_codon:yes stop_codon:yes gene_type:complete